ncbi:MAG: hypothetical protein ACODAD_01500 [Planctomycetota bacterium]
MSRASVLPHPNHLFYLAALLCGGLCFGCAPLPIVKHQPQYHNPFPQLKRVAILPFFNLSSEPTVNQDEVAEAYFNELQAIRGFEVMPPGVVKQWLQANEIKIDSATDFQFLARQLGVDVLIRGAVTEYSPYYPPRIGLAVDWYAANPSFHPIPPGYGLPWGTSEEEYIPDSLAFEAEFALAREQLDTQTPKVPPDRAGRAELDEAQGSGVARAGNSESSSSQAEAGGESQAEPLPTDQWPALPPDWPDPRGFVPRLPSPVRPPYQPQPQPIITHTRIYRGDDEKLTQRLEDYCFFRDDARIGGWQSYLVRSQDFIRFSCHLHIAEVLAARGGSGETRVVWRWPIDR